LIKYGFLCKLHAIFPTNIYNVINSYLHHRHFFIRYREAYSTLHPVSSGVPQGSVLGLFLYLIYTADLPTTPNTITANFADDTAVLATNADPVIAAHKLQTALTDIQHWFTKWRLKANELKSSHVTFKLKRFSCPPVQLNGTSLRQPEVVKYPGMQLNRRFTWRKQITSKRRHLDLQLRKLYWIIGRKSQLSLENKLLLYKAILKPIWAYGIQLWGTASNSNIDILEGFQAKVLRIITGAPRYEPNAMIHRDILVSTFKHAARTYSITYRSTLVNNPNKLAPSLVRGHSYPRRLKRKHPQEVQTSFLLVSSVPQQIYPVLSDCTLIGDTSLDISPACHCHPRHHCC